MRVLVAATTWIVLAVDTAGAKKGEDVPLVTKESVFAAAERLQASGRSITYAAVRDEIGGESMRDIGTLYGSGSTTRCKRARTQQRLRCRSRRPTGSQPAPRSTPRI